jgi:hypothetical protein
MRSISISISSDVFIHALTRAGFVIYRRAPPSTILERGTRAVVVPERARLSLDVLSDLRKMAGLTWREVEALLGDSSSP